MLFNSLAFLVFFPVVVGLYFGLPHRWRWTLLLAASYFFYMYWKPIYAVLIAGSGGYFGLMLMCCMPASSNSSPEGSKPVFSQNPTALIWADR